MRICSMDESESAVIFKRHPITFCLPVHVWSSVKVTTCLYGPVKGTWADSHMPRGSAPSSTVMSLHPVTMWWVALHTCTTLISHFSHSHGINSTRSDTGDGSERQNGRLFPQRGGPDFCSSTSTLWIDHRSNIDQAGRKVRLEWSAASRNSFQSIRDCAFPPLPSRWSYACACDGRTQE